MIALFTDFGLNGPYVGQMHAVFAHSVPQERVIDLFHDVPHYHIRAAAYLLPAYAASFPESTVFLCVVDPGVGGERAPVALRADGCWYVGPDNGLFQIVARRARQFESYEITWRPTQLSSSFHGRDLFAPVAASLARGAPPEMRPVALTVPPGPVWPEDLAEIIYIDTFGNAVTGIQAERFPNDRVIRVGGRQLAYAPTFSAMARGEAFWYRNSSNLVEIAVNQGSAATQLGLCLGEPLEIR